MKRLLILLLMLVAGAVSAQTLPPQRFTWTRPVTGEPAVRYVVQARADGGAWTTVATVVDTFHVFADLAATSSWEVRVAGLDALDRQGVFSQPSLPIQGDQGPPGPPGVPVLENP